MIVFTNSVIILSLLSPEQDNFRLEIFRHTEKCQVYFHLCNLVIMFEISSCMRACLRWRSIKASQCMWFYLGAVREALQGHHYDVKIIGASQYTSRFLKWASARQILCPGPLGTDWLTEREPGAQFNPTCIVFPYRLVHLTFLCESKRNGFSGIMFYLVCKVVSTRFSLRLVRKKYSGSKRELMYLFSLADCEEVWRLVLYQ